MLRERERGVLAIAVVVGSGAGVFALSRVFEPHRSGDRHLGRNRRRVLRRIAYVANVEAANDFGLASVISSVGADGSDPTRLVEFPGMITGLDWSPDGARLAFAANVDRRRFVFVMEADGSELSGD